MSEKLPYWLRRSIAYILDCAVAYILIMLLVQALLLAPLRGYLGITDEWFHDPWQLEGYILSTISLPVWLYFSLMESSGLKATLGKKLMKLEVSQLSSKPLTFRKAFIRTFVKLLPWELAHLGVVFPTPLYFSESENLRWISWAGILLLSLYFISLFINKRTQTIYDKLMGVEIIKLNSETKLEHPT